jgi:hypothetical protein
MVERLDTAPVHDITKVTDKCKQSPLENIDVFEIIQYAVLLAKSCLSATYVIFRD